MLFGHPRFYRIATAALLLTAAGAGFARAQQHIDYTLQNPRISPQTPSSFYVDPSVVSDQFNVNTQKFINRAPNMDKFLPVNQAALSHGNLTMPNSPQNGKMDNSPLFQQMFPRSGNLTQKMFPQQNTRDPKMSADSRKYSNLDDYTQSSRLDSHITGPSKFTDSFVFHPADDNTKTDQVGRELSLRDINRYQFQGSHSGEPGLPYVQAGGNAGQPGITGSGLASGPATFDGGALQSGKIHSGTSDQIKLITQNGSRPFSSSPLGQASKSSGLGANSFDNTQSGYETVWSRQKSTAANNVDKQAPTGGSMIPSGDYTPTTSSGKQIPMHFDPPRMIIQVQKGGFVGVDEEKKRTYPNP